MVTLAITKNLVSECKRDLNYFSKSAQAVVNSALQCAATGGAGGRRDLELSARAASTFYALATFTDPATASIDAELGQTYQTLLVQFARMAMESPASHGADAEKEAGGELKDREIRNR